MPEAYLKIKRSMRKAHKDWSAKRVEKIAAMTYNKIAAKRGLPTVGRGRA